MKRPHAVVNSCLISRPSLTMLARVKSFFLSLSFFLSFHSFFLFSTHTSPFTPASGLVRLPLTNCIDDHGSLVIYRFDPTISSIKTSTMITNSNSLFRERNAQSYGRRLTSRHGRVRAFPRSNRIQPTANIANCCATMPRSKLCRIRVHDVRMPVAESVLSSGSDRRNAA
jgi:hypothetical protein